MKNIFKICTYSILFLYLPDMKDPICFDSHIYLGWDYNVFNSCKDTCGENNSSLIAVEEGKHCYCVYKKGDAVYFNWKEFSEYPEKIQCYENS